MRTRSKSFWQKSIGLIGLFLLGWLPAQAAKIENNYPFARLALPELLIGVGTRSTAMGGAGAALSEDLTAVYWNPAGLVRVPNMALEIVHNAWIQNVNHETLLLGLPVGEAAYLAGGVNYFGLGTIEKTSEAVDGSIQFDKEKIDLSLFSGSLGLGWEAAPELALGGAFKFAMENLGLKTPVVAALDLGVQYLGAGDNIEMGLALENLGLGVEGFSLPFSCRLGAGFAPELSTDNFLTLGLDLEMPLGAFSQSLYHVGLEYRYTKILAVRAGYQLGSVNGLTFGLGVGLGAWTLGYSYAPQSELGVSHRVSLGIDCYELAKPQPKVHQVKKEKSQPATLERPRMSFGIREIPPTQNLSQPTYPRVSQGEDMMRELLETKLQVKTQVKRSPDQSGYQVAFQIQRASSTRIKQWNLTLLDQYDQKIRYYQGDKLPKIIRWNGKDQEGAELLDLTVVQYRLVIVDVNDEQETSQGKIDLVAPQPSPATDEEEAAAETAAEEFNQKIFGPIEFDAQRAEITPAGAEVISAAAKFIHQNPSAKIYIDGYCDGVEEKTDALMLSKARAEAVARYLTAYHKVQISRILIKARGSRNPLASNTDEARRYQNRRVMITVRNR